MNCSTAIMTCSTAREPYSTARMTNEELLFCILSCEDLNDLKRKTRTMTEDSLILLRKYILPALDTCKESNPELYLKASERLKLVLNDENERLNCENERLKYEKSKIDKKIQILLRSVKSTAECSEISNSPSTSLNVDKKKQCKKMRSAIALRKIHKLEKYLRRGYDPNIRFHFDNSSEINLLAFAAIMENKEAVELLIKSGANIHDKM